MKKKGGEGEKKKNAFSSGDQRLITLSRAGIMKAQTQCWRLGSMPGTL